MAMMVCSEWWAYEFISLMTGYLGVIPQATNIILFQLTCLLYAIGVGLQSTACTLVGKQIGRGDVKKARSVFATFKYYAAAIIFSVTILFMLVRRQFLLMFTSDERILELGMSTSMIIAVGIIPDHW